MFSSAIRLSLAPRSAGRILSYSSAGAYAACYHGALLNAANKFGTSAEGSKVRALVSLIEDDQGGYRLAVELHAQLPGVDPEQAKRVMEAAHVTCPYSKALRGDTAVTLVVD